MEDVCSVIVYLNAVHLPAIDVAARMQPLVHHQATLSSARGFVGKHCAKEARTHNQIVISRFHYPKE